MTSTLRTLLDRVEMGEGADRDLDWNLQCVFGIVGTYGDHLHFTSSIDVAVALVEQVLPAHPTADHERTEIHLAMGDFGAQAFLNRDTFDIDKTFGAAKTAPRAILAATLRAKIAQEERT